MPEDPSDPPLEGKGPPPPRPVVPILPYTRLGVPKISGPEYRRELITGGFYGLLATLLSIGLDSTGHLQCLALGRSGAISWPSVYRLHLLPQQPAVCDWHGPHRPVSNLLLRWDYAVANVTMTNAGHATRIPMPEEPQSSELNGDRNRSDPQPLDYGRPETDSPALQKAKLWHGLLLGFILPVVWFFGGANGFFHRRGMGAFGGLIFLVMLEAAICVVAIALPRWRRFGIGLLISIPLVGLILLSTCAFLLSGLGR